jgi:pimeloyl-ACP methyl ester carboxylesterase
MPTLLVWGERDIALGRELTEGMEDLFDGPFTLKYVPDASHWVQQDRPDLCNRWLVEHLRA